VIIAFVNAYASTENEQRAAEAVRAIWPNPHVAASHEILPEIREFERFSTAALNGYLQPVVATYLDRLERGLQADGFGGDLLVVQSNGGVMTAATARALPVRTALSGPAAGVIACSAVAAAAGYSNVVTCDVGGTSFDASLIVDGEMVLAQQAAIDFGLVVRSPMIEIVTIGAGGGSIARVEAGGLLEIGPESAGSNPGPVCYGRGNDRPTVTDANLVLGRLDAEVPIGALPRLDREAAERAIARHVGEPLGLTPVAAAEAIVRVANSRMAGALRLVSIERGLDPRRFAMMPFGGGGGLHAGALIREVGFECALAPRFPGVLSALGCVIADMRHDFVRTINGLVASTDMRSLQETVAAFDRAGQERLDGSGVAFTSRRTQIEFDMCYLGQTHTVAVPFPAGQPITAEALEAAFAARYQARFGRLLSGIAVRLINLRVAVIGTRPKLDLTQFAPANRGDPAAARIGARPVHFMGNWHQTALFDRPRLPIGAVVEGPAILTQPDTTIVIEPGQRAVVDRFGNLILSEA
jgi:N-methylhydantoinase A